jgi:hypothetical protein
VHHHKRRECVSSPCSPNKGWCRYSCSGRCGVCCIPSCATSGHGAGIAKARECGGDTAHDCHNSAQPYRPSQNFFEVIAKIHRSLPDETGKTLKDPNMPLPHIKSFCRANSKSTGTTCQNPTAFQSPVCRLHGAKRPQSIVSGPNHGRYRSGAFTMATKAAYKEASRRLADLDTVARDMGLISGPRTRGPKPS